MLTVNRTAYTNLTFSPFFWSSTFTDGLYFPRKNASEWGPVIIIPLLATIVLAITVFLLVMFRQNPTFVISTVAGCLIFITIYLILVALDSTKQFLY
ncbi:unnamed protein product [Phyllotreta striolata]|uniref:Uncharacterized protein n=1 Tax=Phyllotreta striolata TaxID=444603 RepID=A0A9N9TQ30_PHYSR|nr:unnamed protein product [Phyllotreta striolata]